MTKQGRYKALTERLLSTFGTSDFGHFSKSRVTLDRLDRFQCGLDPLARFRGPIPPGESSSTQLVRTTRSSEHALGGCTVGRHGLSA
jgi:hypothetical protein